MPILDHASRAERYTGRAVPNSRGFFENGLVALTLRRREVAVEIGVERAERELAAIRILKPQFAVLNDAGAIQNTARDAKQGDAPDMPSPPLSLAQLAEVALDPALTLYP